MGSKTTEKREGIMAKAGKLMGFSTAMVLALGLVVPPGSWGQAAKEKRGAATAPLEIEEITVTAQKREENIQEIPISVTAVTGAALEEQGIPSLLELGHNVPNMHAMSSSSGEATVQVSMRGTFSGETSLAQAPSVGFHVDGFYLAKNLGNNMDLEDLERVEVLRGPQGTLFGRNTTGGAINMVSKKPTEQRSITLSTGWQL
jgi:iron complex outermembrane receptor protein